MSSELMLKLEATRLTEENTKFIGLLMRFIDNNAIM